MQKTEPKSAKASFGVQDILFVLFKHKWKILICSVLGFTAAAAVYLARKPLYESSAKILIKDVIQRGGVDVEDNVVATGGRSGDQAINTELEILRSEDLATEVAEAVGLDRIIPDANGEVSPIDAAYVVMGGLEVSPVSRGSNIVLVTFRNPDPLLTRDVLQEVMRIYPDKHLEVHRSTGAIESVANEEKEARARLERTEKELNRLRSESRIISVSEESLSYATRRDKMKQDLINAQAEHDELAEKIKSLDQRLGGAAQPVAVAEEDGEAVPRAIPLPTQQELEEYRALTRKLEYYEEQDLELRKKFAGGSSQVVRNQAVINGIKAERNAMIAENAGLAMEASAEPSGEVDPRVELERDRDALKGIEARIRIYQKSLADLEARFDLLTTTGSRINELERRLEMENAEYRMLASKLKTAEVDHNLDPTKLSGLPVVQRPSVPIMTYSELTKKIILGLAGAGVAVGLGLAFLIELVVDRRIKRPTEIETRLQVPLMLSIPFVRPKNRGGLLISNERGDEVENGGSNLPALREPNGKGAFVGKTDHFIHPYSEAIRDRIVFNFQINNMTHKPKMMAVTGLSAGSGTSTIAAGLAKAFSEINGAKVLLVDLNSDYPEDNPMFGNKPLHTLAGALQTARNTRFKEGSQNLYLASAGQRKGEAGSASFGPMHLYEMLPHFRASEFDYVIFDMPAMDKTSPTLSMAGLMDKVLLVVDGEDTSRDALKWGYSELVKGRADVSCVFNKARSHAPRWVAGEM